MVVDFIVSEGSDNIIEILSDLESAESYIPKDIQEWFNHLSHMELLEIIQETTEIFIRDEVKINTMIAEENIIREADENERW